MRIAVDEGQSATGVVEGARPPIHFRRKSAIDTALRAWTTAKLLDAMSSLSDALLRNATSAASRRCDRATIDADAGDRGAEEELTSCAGLTRTSIKSEIVRNRWIAGSARQSNYRRSSRRTTSSSWSSVR